MRALLFSVLVLAFSSLGGFADMLEFPALTGASLEIPAGTSIKTNYASPKGGAAPYMKFQLRVGENTFELGAEFLSPLYINGPATLTSVPAVVTPTSGIPYKYLGATDGYMQGTWPILYDANGTGEYSTTLYSDDSRYQAYLSWLANGNTPIPANAYTGNEVGSSGVLIKYYKYSNQPFRSLLCANGSTQTINIPAGKKLVIPYLDGFGMGRMFRVGDGGGASILYFTTSNSSPFSLLCMLPSVTIKGGYSVNSPGCEIDGPEVVTITYNKPASLGGGGSATSTSEGGSPEFAIFTYYFADEYNEPISDSAATAIATKITSTAGNYGIATKSELTASLTQSRTDGINSVLSNPNLWTLYTTSQIQNMAVGDLVLTKNVGGTFTLNYDIEQSADLQTWTTYAPLSLPLTGLPTDKAFVRIQIKSTSSTTAPTTPAFATPF
jgi:hypothetical protein